jgi:hypothetical protein
LLHTDLPALVKYPVLALTTYAASNLLALTYAKIAGRRTAAPALPAARHAAAARREHPCAATSYE